MKQLPNKPSNTQEVTIQMSAGKGLDIDRFQTFDDFSYQFFRFANEEYDFLGRWDQDSDRKHGFQAFDEPHKYIMWFTGLVPVEKKLPKLTEKETSDGVDIRFKFTALEFVNFDITRT